MRDVVEKKKNLLEKLRVKLIQEQYKGKMKIEVTVNELVWLMNALEKEL